uniref:Uncharacterized protein n=1 Tax=Rhizophora mucronata TaxID=61149 RepID=A0A2P2IZZ7_RHIMU
MGWNHKAPWKLAELERQNVPGIAQTTVFSNLRVH